jgi:hypothetical protein
MLGVLPYPQASQGTEDAALEVSDDDDFDIVPSSARSQPAAAAAAALPPPQPRRVPPAVTSGRLKQNAKSAELQERLQHLQQMEYAREDEPDSPLVVVAAPGSKRRGRQQAAGRQRQAAAAAPALVGAARQQQAAHSEVVIMPEDEDADVDWQQLAQDIGATASPERAKQGAAGAAASSAPAAAAGDDVSGGAAAEGVELVFRCSSGSLKLQVPKEGPLGPAMEQFTAQAVQQGWLAAGKAAKFKFDGDRVTEEQTPSELDVDDEDIIDVVL